MLKKFLNYLSEQEIKIMVISGDDPVTVSSIAQIVEIKDGDKYIDVSTLNEEELNDCVKDYTVFGRVKPEQKKQISRSPQKTRIKSCDDRGWGK